MSSNLNDALGGLHVWPLAFVICRPFLLCQPLRDLVVFRLSDSRTSLQKERDPGRIPYPPSRMHLILQAHHVTRCLVRKGRDQPFLPARSRLTSRRPTLRSAAIRALLSDLGLERPDSHCPTATVLTPTSFAKSA